MMARVKASERGDAPTRDVRQAGGPRWVTVFNGSRDHYQLALALEEVGRLERLVTDWYSPLDRPLVRAVYRHAPPQWRAVAERRYHAGLPSCRVVTLPGQALRQRLRRASLPDVDARLGAAAGAIARRRGAGIFAYNFYAYAAFNAYGAGPAPRLLFQAQAHPMAFRAILAEERELATTYEARAALDSEPELAGRTPRFAELCAEPLLADRIVVPSSYVKRTLVVQGVGADRIDVIPYGVDLERFRPSAQRRRDNLFRVLFVGQLLRRKGLEYLLRAWQRLSLPDAELVLVGRGHADRALLATYEGSVRVERDVHSADRMRALYQSADLCCLPTLSDSFGHVYLESLACGTPIVGTPNSGAPDLITEGESGFVVPIRDPDALEARLLWAYEHRDALAAMRVEARRRAACFSWPAFRGNVVGVVDDAVRTATMGAVA